MRSARSRTGQSPSRRDAKRNKVARGLEGRAEDIDASKTAQYTSDFSTIVAYQQPGDTQSIAALSPSLPFTSIRDVALTALPLEKQPLSSTRFPHSIHIRLSLSPEIYLSPYELH
jgi:hypothetical protein